MEIDNQRAGFEGYQEEIEKNQNNNIQKSETSGNHGQNNIDRNIKWYERFGFEQDPFDHRNLSPRVLGHDDKKLQLIEWIKEGTFCFAAWCNRCR